MASRPAGRAGLMTGENNDEAGHEPDPRATAEAGGVPESSGGCGSHHARCAGDTSGGYEVDQISYHLSLIEEAGLIDTRGTGAQIGIFSTGLAGMGTSSSIRSATTRYGVA